ncbi:membrane traffic protein [Lithospermum erythrorhizon]|uniref:Endoplasmic reticulum transmembrane protein n=1 Tax=Lithospermum erythrorhizon TaxID=34254 RepID=A0AAV3PPX2_LITER
MIIQPLFFLVFVEIIVILTLLFRTPLRRPLITVLDALKKGRGPVISTTIGVTLLVVLISILFNVTKLQTRAKDSGNLNPTDQLLLAYHILEASLLG